MTWVPVDVLAPNDQQQVWITFHFDCPESEGGGVKNSHQGYAIYTVDDGFYFDVDTDATLMGRKECMEKELLACTITHWMSLPEGPFHECA